MKMWHFLLGDRTTVDEDPVAAFDYSLPPRDLPEGVDQRGDLGGRGFLREIVERDVPFWG
jgi:hypothetical protein